MDDLSDDEGVEDALARLEAGRGDAGGRAPNGRSKKATKK